MDNDISFAIFIMIILIIVLFVIIMVMTDEIKRKDLVISNLHNNNQAIKSKIENLRREKNKEIEKIKETHKKEVKKIFSCKKEELFKEFFLNKESFSKKYNIAFCENIDFDDELFNQTSSQRNALKKSIPFIKTFTSNLTAIPYMSAIMADYETYGLEALAKKLDWGYSVERAKKVKSIREIRKDAKAMIEKNKESQYQLSYLLSVFPNLKDVIECDFNQLPVIDVNDVANYDATRDYLSKEEYQSLSVIERNQLALDRYKKSHNKTKWQIGRDYELYVGYRYAKKGYDINYFGSYMGMEDLGRDIIAKKDNTTLIIQCKYWSSIKQIHEKHISQLYGTMVSYCIENNLESSAVKGILITNICLSDMAKKFANYLGIEYKENFDAGDYPCIKCNIGHGECGEKTKIYHLPFDQQYDSTKIREPGEFYAMTVEEAEKAGFRRAFKWFGS